MSSKPDMFRVTTLSGSVYEIDVTGAFFRKLGPYAQDGWQRLWVFRSAPADGLKPHLDREWRDVVEPVVGEHLFLASRDLWWSSTLVTKVERVVKDRV